MLVIRFDFKFSGVCHYHRVDFFILNSLGKAKIFVSLDYIIWAYELHFFIIEHVIDLDSFMLV